MFELEKDNYRSMHGDDIDAHCYSQPENKPHITSTAPITNVNSTPKIEKHDTNGELCVLYYLSRYSCSQICA